MHYGTEEELIQTLYDWGKFRDSFPLNEWEKDMIEQQLRPEIDVLFHYLARGVKTEKISLDQRIAFEELYYRNVINFRK